MKISIITATYNSADTLRDTIESVLRQTYPDVEYIIVDGASTDGTIDIVREYEPHFGERMRWISESDHGIYDALNKGIDMATGEVVGFLHSDDFFTSPDIIERLAKEMAGGNVDAVYGDVHYVSGKNLNKCVRYYSSAFFKRWTMLFGLMPAHPTFYCRKEVYGRFGTFSLSYRVAADFECLLRLIYIGKISLKYVPLDCVAMRTGGASTSGLTSHMRIFKDHVRAYRENHVPSNALLDSLRYIFKLWEAILFKIGLGVRNSSVGIMDKSLGFEK